MKKIISFFIANLILLNITLGQCIYFLISESNSQFVLRKYTLLTDELYKLKDSIIIYNLIFNTNYNVQHKNESELDENLILFSVLPSVDGESWEEIDLDTITNSVVNFYQLRDLFDKNTNSRFDLKYGEQTKYWNEYKIITLKNGKYYIPKNVLLQFYAIRNRPDIFNNPYGTININQEMYSIKTVQEIYENKFSNIFPLFSFRNFTFSRFDRLRDRKEFLSNKYKIGDKNAFQFWTYTDWNLPQTLYNYERGIDRFIYIPNIGIVGGSFDFYFLKNKDKLNLKNITFVNNIIEEKVMLAKELK